MATQSKTQFLTNIHTLLKRRYKPKTDRNASRLSVLKAVVYGICHEDTTREQANQALSRFKDEFFDWNEIRVSAEEIQETLAGIPDPHERPSGSADSCGSSSIGPTASPWMRWPRNRSRKLSRFCKRMMRSHPTTSRRP